jgi:uncharacterized lipoprotein YddW (UPF0748 family)
MFRKQAIATIITITFSVSLLAQGIKKENVFKGTWITNVGSDAMLTEKNVRTAVALCKKKSINNIFVVVWNNGKTMYPSEWTQQYIGLRQDTVYHGFDPLEAIISEAHAVGIKVHAWFEFGFSYAYKDSSSPWITRYPQWAARKKDGSLLGKNGFYWLNGLYPPVQDFMVGLVTEVVKNYEVDGVQGDDRLPAMPSEGGYDEFTRSLYSVEHPGRKVPDDPKEKEFLQWKADKLSALSKRLYDAVKKIKPGCLVSWAPSIYPWSKEEYCQDWPQWIKGGYADLVIPQVYRYDLNAYENTLKQMKNTIPEGFQLKVFPGMLTSLSDGYRASAKMIKEMIRLNRQYGFNGEVFFYYETLNRLQGKFYPAEK